jgi:hypothetical protein
MLSKRRLLELFEINVIKGTVIRKKQCGRAKADVHAGYINGSGYRIICIDRVDYFEHDLIWFMKHGELVRKPLELDHKDRNKANNAIGNLRKATRGQNNANAKRRRDNNTGCRGVYFDTQRQLYGAQVTVKGMMVFNKRFKKFKDAARASKTVREKYWGEFHHA